MPEDGFRISDVEAAHKIIAHLLCRGDIDAGNPELLRLYESAATRAIVEIFAREIHVAILAGADFIYMLPDSDNFCLGFSMQDFKEKLAKGGLSKERCLLAFFAITVLLVSFYDGEGASCLTRQYINFGEYENAISTYLKKGATRYTDEEQDASGLLFKEMSQSYESLISRENMENAKSKSDKRIKNTKQGFLARILEFLQKQKLIVYIKESGKIFPTQKLTNIMSYHVLALTNYESLEQFKTVKYVLSEIDSEQN